MNRYNLVVMATEKHFGSIVAILYHGHDYGLVELSHCLIVPFEDTKSIDELRKVYIGPVFGENNDIVFKHRYRLDIHSLETMSGIDLESVKNISKRYQPFMKRENIVKKFDGKAANKFLTAKDVDAGNDPESEVFFKMDILRDMIFDMSTQR